MLTGSPAEGKPDQRERFLADSDTSPAFTSEKGANFRKDRGWGVLMRLHTFEPNSHVTPGNRLLATSTVFIIRQQLLSYSMELNQELWII